MKPSAHAATGRWAALLIALGGSGALALGPASCTLDVNGTAPGPTTGGPGGGGPGSGGGGQGGAAPGVEDCLDGVDNDGDGVADCADTEDCAPADFACVDAPPDGWTGNVRAARAPHPAGGALPECPAGTTPLDRFAEPAADAQCSACDCAWTGASCTPPELSCWWSTESCSGSASVAYNNAQAQACVEPSYSSFTGSCRITAPGQLISPGTCAIADGGGTLQNPDTWATDVRLCAGAAPGAGCDGGQVCVPRATTGSPELDDAICITREGTDPCPDGWTDLDLQTYEGATDDRKCSACSCDLAQVGCANGSWRAYDLDACLVVIGGVADIAAPDCTPVSDYLDSGSFSLMAYAAEATEPPCPASQPSGSVAPAGPTKLCCKAAP